MPEALLERRTDSEEMKRMKRLARAKERKRHAGRVRMQRLRRAERLKERGFGGILTDLLFEDAQQGPTAERRPRKAASSADVEKKPTEENNPPSSKEASDDAPRASDPAQQPASPPKNSATSPSAPAHSPAGGKERNGHQEAEGKRENTNTTTSEKQTQQPHDSPPSHTEAKCAVQVNYNARQGDLQFQLRMDPRGKVVKLSALYDLRRLLPLWPLVSRPTRGRAPRGTGCSSSRGTWAACTGRGSGATAALR